MVALRQKSQSSVKNTNKWGSIQRPYPDNGLYRTTAYCVQRPCTTAYYGQRPTLYNGLLFTTAFFVQRPPKTGHRPFLYNGLKNVGQRPHDTTAPENFTTALNVQRPQKHGTTAS